MGYNRFKDGKKKPRVVKELSPEEWARLNENFFGKENADGWTPEKNDSDMNDDDVTEELHF